METLVLVEEKQGAKPLSRTVDTESLDFTKGFVQAFFRMAETHPGVFFAAVFELRPTTEVMGWR